ncbi:MAG: hypothetical protein AAGI48_13320 [Verrucomicrobiota bacterium]
MATDAFIGGSAEASTLSSFPAIREIRDLHGLATGSPAYQR